MTPVGAAADLDAQSQSGRPLELGKAWREMLHRYAAGTLGVLIVCLAAMAVATVFGMLGELCSGVLRGAGRTGIAAIITATYVTINLGIVSADLALHGGLMVVPIAAGAAGAVEIALGFGALVHVGLVRPRRLTAWRPDTWRMLLRIGLPVGITSVVLAVVDLVLLRIVGHRTGRPPRAVTR